MKFKNVKLKRVVSSFLSLAVVFSLVQFGNTVSVKAADSEGTGDTTGTSSESTLDDTDTSEKDESLIDKFTVSLGNDEEIKIVDKVGGQYVAEYIPVGNLPIIVKPKVGYTIKSITTDSANVTFRAAGTKNFQATDITNYSTFIMKVVLDDDSGNGPYTYSVKMRFDVDASLQFSKILISNDENANEQISLDYANDKNKYGEYVANVSDNMKSAKIELLDDSGDTIKDGVEINGENNNVVPLSGGDNEFVISITSNGISKKYTLILHKKGKALLQSLELSDGEINPEFNPSVTDYTVNVGPEVSKIAITPTAVDNSSSISVNSVNVPSGSKSRDIKLKEGSNDIYVSLKTEDGDSETYVITVIRAETERSSRLSDLSLSSGELSPEFNPGIYDYTALVDNNTDRIQVTPTTEFETSTVEVNGEEVQSANPTPFIELEEGANIITVAVTDSKGSYSTYTIVVTRQYPEDNVNLSSLTVTDGTLSPSFDPYTYMYKVKVGRAVSKVRVKFTTQNTKSTIKIGDKTYESGQQSNYINLELGPNLVTVEVTGEDSTSTTKYRLSIIRGDVTGHDDWVVDGDNMTYYNTAGVLVKNDWVHYNNKWYYMDINGYMQTGWQYIGKRWYYFNENGIMMTGWLYYKGYWYYLQGDGSAKTNSWGAYDGKWHYFNEYGQIKTSGWIYYKGYWYYFNSKGEMQIGWLYYDKNYYYLKSDGTMAYGWMYTGTSWRYLGENGASVIGYQWINGKQYYFDSNGMMYKGMHFVDGRWIDFNNL
ncbi:cadherin-like beta sandwich domain-containing protein [Clostridium sp. BJN0001]|uniref:cadherin-like beta sandwich domain-containing protein n=1 Tax=Clostridium sp. BJN0001 TaxID=2930219 RepID=UPI001FD266BC|nr:cadherin-like beta sandwich domain-containing protein [Clostridium sp. BJN0001]